MNLFLSRARLRTDAPVRALRDVLLPNDENARVAAAHRLVWTLFGDVQERKRDFLWRETNPGEFILLSSRPPEDPHGMFELDTPKPFTPEIAVGDRLRFSLRANATVSQSLGRDIRGRPQDVVMSALYALGPAERAAQRSETIVRVGREWMGRQGERAGFKFSAETDCRIVSHRVLALHRPGKSARIGVLDVEGELVVTEPSRFVDALSVGFGRAKAFGNGLMLIRRV